MVVIIIGGKAFEYGVDEDVDALAVTLMTSHIKQVFHQLKSTLRAHFVESNEISMTYSERSSVIRLTCLYDSDNPGIKFALSIHCDLSMSLLVHRKPISMDHEFWLGLPKKLFTGKDVNTVVEKLRNWRICPGNCEDQFQSLVSDGVPICTSTFQNVAFKEGDMGEEYNQIIEMYTADQG